MKRLKCDDETSYEIISRFVIYDESKKRFFHIKWVPNHKINDESKEKFMTAINNGI